MGFHKRWSQIKIIAAYRKILWTAVQIPIQCTANFAPEAILLKIPILYFYFDSINAEIASIGIFYNLYFRALRRIVELRNFIFPS